MISQSRTRIKLLLTNMYGKKFLLTTDKESSDVEVMELNQEELVTKRCFHISKDDLRRLL